MTEHYYAYQTNDRPFLKSYNLIIYTPLQTIPCNSHPSLSFNGLPLLATHYDYPDTIGYFPFYVRERISAVAGSMLAVTYLSL